MRKKTLTSNLSNSASKIYLESHPARAEELIYINIYICVCVCVCVFVYIYIYIYICVCVCVCDNWLSHRFQRTRVPQPPSILMPVSHMTFQTSHRLACKSAVSECRRVIRWRCWHDPCRFHFLPQNFDMLKMGFIKVLDGLVAFCYIVICRFTSTYTHSIITTR